MISEEARARIGATQLVASVSGGKDSAAMCLHLRELELPYEAVFMDTGWESRVTYDYIRGPLTEAIGPIRWLRAEVPLDGEREEMAQELEAMLGHYSAMVRLCIKKAMMPARQVRWCTQTSKVEPLFKWLDTLDADVTSVVGIRHDESAARAKMEEWEWSDKRDGWTWRPIIRWSLDDVIAIHARHGLTPNPLYLSGASRVGCWPCIFARKSEIRMWSEADPWRVKVVERLEEIIANLYSRTEAGKAVRRAARWYCDACGSDGECMSQDCPGTKVWMEERQALAYLPPTWFQHNSERTPEMKVTGYAWPIARVIEWSRTARGGRQFELFAAADSDSGCMRWGLCDTGAGGNP